MLWPYLAELSFPNERKPEICGFPAFNFHGKESWRAAASCSAGSLREAFAQQTEHKLARTARRASDSKSAEHKKSFSGAAWIFCMEPNSFGVTRGEQPLVRASRASKVAGAFLVLFWHAKENIPGGDASCKRHETLNTRLRSVRKAFQIRRWPSQPPLPAR